MNFIFTVILILSVSAMIFTNPDAVIASMTGGVTKAVTLSITLVAVYALWSGITEVAEKTGINGKIAKLLSPIIDFLFKKQPEEIKKQLSLNVSANLFGLGGIATPTGIKSAELLGKNSDYRAMDVLFVLSATSIQLLPTTVITLRQQYGSAMPSDIFLPTLLSTAVSTFFGLSLLSLFQKQVNR